MMNSAYILLVITVIISLFCRDKKVLYPAIMITNIAGVYCDVVTAIGLVSLIIFALITYFHSIATNNLLKWVLCALVLLCAVSFSFHFIPGFSNFLVLDKVKVSDLSSPFSMYLNFDKVMCAVILYSLSDLYAKEQKLDRNSFKQTLRILVLCVIAILTQALYLNYIEFDLKLPDIFLIWVVNNFFFVCFAEEVLFRGFIQGKLKTMTAIPYIHIVLASLLFGLAHFKGGLVYTILASICGLFYGYAYEKTNRIICSMIVHIGLNLTHLIFFTYPFTLLK